MAAMKTAATMHKASSSTEEMLSDLSTDHDETEQKLEKLVFGDNAGFLRNLKNHRGTDHLLSSNDASSNVETPAKDSDDNDLEGVRDSDVGATDSLAWLKGLNSAIAVLPGFWTHSSRCSSYSAHSWI